NSASWYYSDNGFPSIEAMDWCHGSILISARETIGQSVGNVMDLGCGNGVLVSKICGVRMGLVPFGVDYNPERIEHARLLSPKYTGNFVMSDLFCVSSLPQGPFLLSILMVGRLLEAPAGVRRNLYEWLHDCSAKVLLYLYPGYSDKPLAR